MNDYVGLSYLHSRTDRYNKKLKKYQVVYGEEEDSVSEDEEKRESKDHEAFCYTWLNFLSSVPTSPFSLSCLLRKSHPMGPRGYGLNALIHHLCRWVKT